MRLLVARAGGVPPRLERTVTLGVRRFLSPLLFMSPSLVAVLLFFLTPAVLTVLLSTTNMSVVTGFSSYSFIGLENYRRLALSRWTPLILKNTVFYVVMTLMLFNVGLGLLISLLTTHVEDRIGTVFRAIWLLPRITPSVVYALMWLWATSDTSWGIVNQFLGLFGVEPRNWMTAEPWLCVILVNGLVGASFGMIIFTSAIKSIPDAYLMAAKVDGATTFQTIRRVILPLMRWPILFVTAYQTLSLLTSFEYILLTTDGGPGFYRTEVWSLHAYHRALTSYYGNVQFGYGAALATVLVVIGIVAAIICLRVFRFGEMVEDPRIEVS